jgi:hypothetical protein
MAGSLKYYGIYPAYINGELLSEATSVDFNNDNKDSDVETLVLNFSGITPGSDKLMANVSLHDPVGGTMLSRLQKFELNKEIVKIKIVDTGNGKQLVTEGLVRNVSGSSSVGQSSDIKFSFVGLPAAFE